MSPEMLREIGGVSRSKESMGNQRFLKKRV